MNQNQFTIKLLTITTLLLATSSFATAEKFDLQEEQKKLSDKVFNYYDQDKNKALSFDEFSSFSKDMRRKEIEKRVAKTIKSCDKNGNGKIERTEIPTEEALMKLFEKDSFQIRRDICHFREMEFKEIDQNEDNISSTEEMITFYQISRYTQLKIARPNKEQMEKSALKNFKYHLKRCDKNSDNNITLIEITSEQCFMTSNTFLQYSSDPKGSFEVEKVTKAPKYDMEDNFTGMIDRCDENGDKKLDLVEATSNKCHLSSNEFTKIDQDKSGFIVGSELLKKRKISREPNPFIINDNMMKRMPPQVQIRMAFSMCDKNQDRSFTIQEAKDCNLSIEKFKQFDFDKSNTIELSDIKRLEMLEGFKMVDMNEDKKVDAKEFSERMGSRCQVF
jgi:Ca2+-binding EF-hand superfamily protein